MPGAACHVHVKSVSGRFCQHGVCPSEPTRVLLGRASVGPLDRSIAIAHEQTHADILLPLVKSLLKQACASCVLTILPYFSKARMMVPISVSVIVVGTMSQVTHMSSLPNLMITSLPSLW